MFYPTVRFTKDKSKSLNALKIGVFDGHHASIGEKLLRIVVAELPEGQDGGQRTIRHKTNRDEKEKQLTKITRTATKECG